MDLSATAYTTEYLAACAGYPVQADFSTKEVPQAIAEQEVRRRLASGATEEDGITLSILRVAEDFQERSTSQEEYWDGPDGPFRRAILDQVHAFGADWERRYRWVDRARDCRVVWYVRVRGDEAR